MNKDCEIVQDLIPLVNDDVASAASKEMVLEHCKKCERCAELLDEKNIVSQQQIKLTYVSHMRKLAGGLVILCVLLACSFSASEHQFSNFILVPLIGCLGYWVLRKYVYIIYLCIPLTQFIICWLIHDTYSFGTVISYTIIYWIFMTIGVVIYCLYAYAFTGGNYEK